MSRLYRPNGPLRWVVERLPTCKRWDYIGALAAEPRANEAAQELESIGKLSKAQFLCIADEPSEFEADNLRACTIHREALMKSLSTTPVILESQLFSDIDDLAADRFGLRHPGAFGDLERDVAEELARVLEELRV